MECCQLILDAYFKFILQDLPITSYYKLIDFWLLVCFNILVITLGFHTYVASVINKSKREQPNVKSNTIKVGAINEDMNDNQFLSKHQQMIKHATWLNDIAKIVFIVSLIIFNLIFWTIALLELLKSSDEIISSHLSD